MEMTFKKLLVALLLVVQASVFADYGSNIGQGLGNVGRSAGTLAGDAVRAPFTFLGAPARGSDYRRSSWNNERYNDYNNDIYTEAAFRDTLN